MFFWIAPAPIRKEDQARLEKEDQARPEREDQARPKQKIGANTFNIFPNTFNISSNIFPNPLTDILEIAIKLKVSYPPLDFPQKGLAGDPRRELGSVTVSRCEERKREI